MAIDIQGLVLYKIEYDETGKPEPISVPVLSAGKSRLYITDKRVNACKDVDYVQLSDDGADGAFGLYSAVFSLSSDLAMAHWLDNARRSAKRCREVLAELELAFVELGLDSNGNPLPGPAVKAKAKAKAAPKARKKA